MLNAVLALNELDTHVFNSPEPGEAPRVYDDHITVPDAHLLFNGEFKRVGTSDLKIVGEDGQSFFIRDYFTAEKRANLMSPEGATLSAHVVEALAGPLAPGQLAQAGSQAASAQPIIGRVDALTGSATVVRNGVSVALNIGDTVRKGDVVQTAGGSAVAIVFSDGTTFSLNANARMVLNDFVYNASGAGNSAAISLVQGAFSFVAGQVAKTGEMRVETPVATMGIRGTAVLVEISASDGQTKFSVMVEPDGTTGSFNLYNKTTGALIATVNNSAIGWVVSPAGPLQVVAQQVQKTPAELAQELGIVQQIFTIFNNNQQNPFTPPQQDQERRGDNPNDPNPQTASGSGGSGEALSVTVSITTPENPAPTIVTATITPIDTTTDTTPPTTTTTPDVTTPTPTPMSVPTLNIIDFSNYVPPVPQINGTAGADRIIGSNYDDIIDAGAGNDQVFSGLGNDTIIAGHGEGDDFYDGGEGDNDIIKFESANGVVFNLNSGTFNLGADGIVKSSTASSSTTGTDVFVRIEKIVGSPGNDIFILHNSANWEIEEIDAGAGIDIIQAADGFDYYDDGTGPEITNWEIVDLAIDTAENIVYFEVGDFDNIGDGGVILERAPLRILGGDNDIIQVTNHSGTQGHWVLAGTFVDPAGDGTEGDPFNDHFTDDVTFNIYQFVNGETVIGTVYVEAGVQIFLHGAQDDQATMTENEVLFVDVLANDMQGVATTKTLSSLGSATIAGPDGITLGTPEITIQDNKIRVAPGTAFDALAEGETATITIPYTMQAGTGETFVATAIVTVTGTNDAPYFTVLPDNLETLGVTGPGQIDGAGTLKLTSQGAWVQELDQFLGLTEASIADVNGGATNGSAAAFDVALVAGQTISFSWFFDADDYLPFNDFAFFSVALASDVTQKLSDVSIVRNYGDSGWQVMTFTAEDSGLYRLGFGVANVGDTALNSYLYIGGFTGIGLSLTASEDDAPQVIDLLYGAHDLDANDVLSAINIELSGEDQSGNSIFVDGAVTINDYNVSINPVFFSSLSDGESVTVVVDYDLFDGHTTRHNSTTLVINGINDAPVLTGDLSAAVDHGESYQLTTDDLFFTDPDDAAANVVFTVTNLVNGVVVVGESIVTTFTAQQLAAGEVFFTHDGSESVAASFEVSVEDGNEDDSEAAVSTFNLTVNPPPNNAPDAVNDTIGGSGGGATRVGYYDMYYGQGVSSQIASIQTAGYDAINIFSLSAEELANIDVLIVQNPDNGDFGDEYVSQLPTILDAVQNGLVLIIHDRYVDNAESILPGSSGFTIVRNFDDSANIELLDDNHEIASGPGGAVSDTSLDGGNHSSHGFALAGTLPDNADLILSTGDTSDIVTFSYAYGKGYVVYSSIPLDFYLAGYGSSTVNAGMQAYAANLIHYAGETLFDDALTDEDTAVTINASTLLANDTDPDGDILSIVAVSSLSASGAGVTLNGDGTITYDPAGIFEHLTEGETATDSFTYTVSDGRGGTDTATVSFTISGTNDISAAPVIHLDGAATYEKDGEGGAGTTLYGLTVTDDDAAANEIFHITVTSEYGTLAPADPLLNEADEDPENPHSMSFHAALADINNALAQGIIYTDPDSDTQGGVDSVTLTVTDADNNSDSMNFIFSVFGNIGVTLIGTAAKDVMFSTGHNDIFTGGGGNDTFVFGDEGGFGSGQDTITDFTQGQDRIALYGYADMSDLTIAFVDNGRNTQIGLGEGSSITLSGAITLTANDFIFHPSNVLVA